MTKHAQLTATLFLIATFVACAPTEDLTATADHNLATEDDCQKQMAFTINYQQAYCYDGVWNLSCEYHYNLGYWSSTRQNFLSVVEAYAKDSFALDVNMPECHAKHLYFVLAEMDDGIVAAQGTVLFSALADNPYKPHFIPANTLGLGTTGVGNYVYAYGHYLSDAATYFNGKKWIPDPTFIGFLTVKRLSPSE